MWSMRSARAVVTGAVLLGSSFFGTTNVGAAAANLPCGATITSNTTLRADVGPCQGEGLIVRASDVRLNLNGHRVFGASNQGAFAGIRLQEVQHVTVTGGSVAGFDAGVLVFHGQDNTVRGVEVHDNNSTQFVADHPREGQFGDGILILGSSRNHISADMVHDNGPFSGIAVLAETDLDSGSITGPAPADNVIDGNRIWHNDVPDVCPTSGQGGAGTCPPGAAVYSEDIGVRIEGPGASNTTVSGNRITENGRDGISPLNTFSLESPPDANSPPNIDTRVVRNDVEHNGIGTTIYDNDPDIGPVLGEGIFNRCYTDSPQQGCPARTFISGNNFSHNTASGIDIQASQGATIVDNVALFNNEDYTGTFVSQVSIPGPYDDAVDKNPDCDNNT